MQLIRQRVHVLAQSHELLAQGPRNRRRGSIGSTFQATGIDGKAREALRDIVVQVASQPATLILVRGEQTAGEHG